MVTNNFFQSDLPKIHNVVQNAMIVYPKEIVLATLRDYFSQDTYYHYVKDQFGFANTVDQTNLPLEAGVLDNLTTRLFIGENYRQNGQFFPAILIKIGGMKSVPISLNREDGTVLWEIRTFEDGYGNRTFFKHPKSFVFAGAWEGSIIIDIKTRSPRSRDELVQEVSMCLNDITYKSLQKAGVSIKPGSLNVGGTNEQDDRIDKLHTQTITLDVRTEWRREIPISNILEVINFTVEFADLSAQDPVTAQNLTINTNVSFLDIMSGVSMGIKA